MPSALPLPVDITCAAPEKLCDGPLKLTAPPFTRPLSCTYAVVALRLTDLFVAEAISAFAVVTVSVVEDDNVVLPRPLTAWPSTFIPPVALI